MTRDDASTARTDLTALIAPAPMTPRVERLTFAPGATVAQLLTRAVREGLLAAADLPRTEVLINGHPLVDRQAGLDREIRDGDLVNIAVTVHGGGGNNGRKNPLQTILQLAVIVAANYVAGPLGSKLAVAAFAAAGSAMVQAAFAPKIERPSEQGYSLAGQSNQPRPGQAMPLVFGETRVPFDLASSAFTTTIGDETYITAIYGAHYGPCRVAEEKFGETLISTLTGGEVELEYFLTPGPRNTLLYPMRVVEDDFTDMLEFDRSTPSPWVTHPTAINAEAVEGDISFPNGLGFTKGNSGSYVSQEVRGQVQYSAYGANTWFSAPIVDASTGLPFRDRHGALLPAGDWYFQGKSKKALRRTWRFVPPAKGRYDIRVRAWDPENDDPDASTYATMWASLRTIENKPAITDEVLSIIVARWKGSKTLNGQVPTFSGVVTPICPVLDENDDWTGDPAVYSPAWQPTSNALAHARYMLTGYPAARPKRADQIDDSFKAAYRLVEQYGWTGAVVLQQDASQQDALDQLGQMGRSAFYDNGRAMCAVSEWEKPAPKQMFGVTNGKDYRYRRGFAKPIHGVRVEFVNLSQDAKNDELFVPMDGYSEETATVVESYQLPFRATQERAYREGRAWLAKRLYQSESHAWTAGPDAVVSSFGDRVKVRHPGALFGQTDCRVQNRIWSAGAVAGVRLSQAVTMEEGKTYAIEVRTPGREIYGLTVVTQAGTTRNLTFVAPLAVAEAPERDDFVAFGEFEMVTEDVELIDYGPTSSRTVALRAQPYRFEALLAAETGPIPPIQTKVSTRARAPTPTIVQAIGDPSGATVTFSVAGQRTSPVQGFTARWRSTPTAADPAPQWSSLPPLDPDQRQLVTPAFPDAQNTAGEIDAEYKVDIEIRTVLANGDISDPGLVTSLLIDRGVPEPVGFNVGGIKRTAPDGSARPVLSISVEPITTGLVQDLVVERRPAGAADDAWVSAGAALPAKAPYGDMEVAGGATYDVSGQWRTADGWLSPRVVRPGIVVPAGSLVANDSQTTGGKTPAQIVADSGAALAPALDALEDAALAAQVTASAALTALQDPSNGALVRLDRMSKKGSGGALNPNGDFRDWPTSSAYPTGYGFWVAPTALARASTPLGDALDMTSGAGQQCGFLIQAAAMSPPAAGASKVVLEADIELVSGGLAGAALYLQADDGSPGFGNAAGVAVRFTDVAGAGVAGKSYRIRSEPLSLPYVASWTRYVLIAMNHWTGAGSIATANRIRWLRAEAFVASDVEAGYAEDIALLTGADSVAAARISGVEAKQRSLPNLVKNGDASASTTADPLKSWAASAAGMVEPAYDAGYGSLWRLKANTTGASYYFETALSAAPTSGSAMAFSLSGAPGDGTRRYYVAWYNAGAYVAETAPVALTAATLDWEDKRAPLLTSVPAGANQFKVVVVSPAGAGEALLTRLMVNRGASPVPFNNAATDREGLARTAAVELGLVTSDAALANLTNRVGVSMQQGSSIVANARFGAYTNPTGVPDGWLDAALGSTATRQNGQGGHFAPRFVVAAGQDKAIRQVVYLTPGRWVMEMQAWISAGDAQGAGMQISRVDNGAALGVLRCASDPDDNGGVGQGGPGIRRWTKTIDVTYAGDVNIYAFAGYTGLGAVSAKIIDLFVVDLWPVSAPVRAAQADASTALTGVSNLSYSLATFETQTNARFTGPTGEVQVAKAQAIAQSLADTNQAISTYDASTTASFGGLRAATGLLQSAMTTVQGRVLAWLKLTASSGGDEAKVEVVADDGSTLVRMVAKMISLANNVGGVVIDVLKIVGGEVFFGAPVSIDVGGKRLTLGPGFGASADLVWWFGPSAISVAAMTKTNGHLALATDGKVYYGTAELGTGGAVDAVLSKSAEATNLTPNTATHTIVTLIDFGGVAASDLVEGWLGFSGVGATLSSVGAWVGGWEIVEQTTAGGSTHVVGSGGLQIEDAGGGFLDFQVTPDGAGSWAALTPRNLNGSVRYALRLWRASGPDLGGDGITAVLRVRRTP